MKSLRARLLTAALLWIAIGSAAGFWTLSSVFKTYATEQFYAELDEHVRELERLTKIEPDGDAKLASTFSDPRFDEMRSGFYWEVKEDEETILRSPSLADAVIYVPSDKVETAPPVHKHIGMSPTDRFLLVEKVNKPEAAGEPVMRYIVGADQRHLRGMVSSFNRVLGVAFLVFAASMIVVSIGMVSMTLAPFRRLAGAFQDMRAGVTSRVEGDFPSEVSPIVSELNELLASTREMLQRARSQAGNLAHGLKSPLSVIADEAFALEQRGCGAESDVITQQCRIMQRHIDHHIARARASAISNLPGTSTIVVEAAKPILSALGRIYRDKEIDVETEIASGVAVAVDPQDFSEILGNVLDNAFKFARRRIALSAEFKNDGEVIIAIDDDGPGLPPEARSVVFEIGARWDETRSGGGLGLAIVKDLMELYGGACRLEESSLGGLRVVLSLRGSRR